MLNYRTSKQKKSLKFDNLEVTIFESGIPLWEHSRTLYFLFAKLRFKLNPQKMKSIALLFSILLFATVSIYGQAKAINVDWAKTFGKGTDDIAYDIIKDSDGNFVLTGVTKPKGSKNKDLDVLKLDPLGNLLWGKKYGREGNDIANCLVEAHDGGYIIAGSSSSKGRNKNRLGVLKLNKYGDQVWTNTFENQSGGIAKSIIRTNDRGYIVVGHTKSLQADALVVKFNQNGKIEWGKTFGGEKDDKGEDILQLSNGNFVLTGKTNSKGKGGYDLWVLRLDQYGRKLSDKVLGGYRNEVGKSMVATKDGDLIITGEIETRGDGLMDIWAVRIGKDDSMIWEKKFGGSSEDRANTIIQGHGGYVIGGYTKSIGGSKKAWIIKINGRGEVVWEHDFEGRNHSKFKVRKEGTEINSIAKTEDGGYVLAGNTGLFLMNKLIIKFRHDKDDRRTVDLEPEISFRKDEPIVYDQLPENTTLKSVPVESDEKPKVVVEPIPVYQKSDLDYNIPNSYLKNKNTYAVIIGNEDYTTFQTNLNSEVNVDYAENDARIFKEYANKTLGIPNRNITLLINATSGQMQQAISKLEKLAEVSEGKAKLLFYYAGHGLPHEKTKDAYLMPVDISGTNIELGIKLDDLYTRLSKYKTERVTVFLDACFSGAGRNQGLLAMRGVKIRPKKRAPISGNMVIFSSSSGIESSSPFHDEEHGLFTYFLLQKLQSSKGDFRYSDLSQYIYENVRLESVLLNNKEQSPETQVSRDAEDKWRNWRF